MREKWIRVYRSPRWEVVYNTKTLVWRVKRRAANGWHAAIEFVANGLSWKRRVEIPEALWWEVMTQARQGVWRREETNDEGLAVLRMEEAEGPPPEPDWGQPIAPQDTPPRAIGAVRSIFENVEITPNTIPYRTWLDSLGTVHTEMVEPVPPVARQMTISANTERLRMRIRQERRDAEARRAEVQR